MVGYATGEAGSLVYHPEGIMVAENKDRTLVLHAYKYNKDPLIYCQLVDKILLRLLPKGFGDSKGIGNYNVLLDLNQTNLNHLMRMFKMF